MAQRLGQLAQKNERGVTSRSQIGAEILILAKTFQAGRAPSNGANAPKNERGVTSRSKIGTQILIFAKSFQSGRVPEFGTNVPKNEQEVNTFDFTEGWFRSSGLYDLRDEFGNPLAEYQMRIMQEKAS